MGNNQQPDKELDEILEMVFSFAADKNGSDDYRAAGKIDIPEAKQRLSALIEKKVRAELKTPRKSMRGEDPDQYRPRDTVSMSYVEEVIDAHLAKLQDNQGKDGT